MSVPPVVHDLAYWWLVIEGLAVIVIVWRYDRRVAAIDADNEQQWQQIADIVDWLHEFVAEQYGQDGEDTEEMPAVDADDDGPATDVAHPADMFARKLALLARYSHTGQHRA